MGDEEIAKESVFNNLVQTIYHQEDFDFVSIALQEVTGLRKIRWRFAAGNTNERFRRIVLRSGIGIAGLVVRTGEPFIENDLEHHQYTDYISCPITMVEHLTNAVAIPILDSDQLVSGVLLAGYRNHQRVTVHSSHVLQEYLTHSNNS
ncbi:GAF domain-containing protein [Loigolactobacillus iwatensis]|uniref:GAF domain-containing protein n=1 Tax=Loigolactobacillus iwatensis TaxID=1267156 RepID=UPI000F7FA41F|nr:GAF domain-containing protein [Loigolactobacillus iwatensis]